MYHLWLSIFDHYRTRVKEVVQIEEFFDMGTSGSNTRDCIFVNFVTLLCLLVIIPLSSYLRPYE